MLHKLFLLNLSIFNDLVIKNYPDKKGKFFLAFMEGAQLHLDQVLVVEDRTLHCRVLSRQQI